MANLTTILNWFKTGLKPTQSQFAQSFSSFRHKEDKVPVAEVEGIDNLLSSKADAEAFQNHIEDEELHGGATGKYTTTIADGVATAEPWGAIPAGTDVATLKDREISSLIDQALFPTVLAYISSNRSLAVNNMDTATKEVGTSYTDTLVDVIFSPGQIKNGDGSTAGNLTGNLNRVVVKAPDNSTVIDDNAPGSNSVQKSIPSYKLEVGNNVFTFEAYNAAGTTTYTDNKGGTATVESIETAKAIATAITVTKTIATRYYYFVYLGARDSHPTTSSGIRALSNKNFLSASNTASFSLAVPANTSEVVIYTKSGKVVSANNPATNENLTVTQLQFTEVNDAGGDAVQYTRNVIDLGLNGFSSIATFNITIG
ncbi:hypothetical protein FHR24_001511 [Wenyingzhuangia heitensis]|uniref:Uncharacterized protein n=1 Tax=Wenyingzhuangia heitensis TaxID=1487859 RepID=A0ABX0U8B9_9FLAO|nr:hypothetical protein [Wenyingzhuangia heitensis]NIJ45072.1 hypothetical protein [Wenyingzhuangia heitensis]